MTDEDKPKIIHILTTEVRKEELLGLDINGRCAKCHGEVESGFGLAGGGYGVYHYCPKCEGITDKNTIED